MGGNSKISTDHDLISPPNMTRKFPSTDSAQWWPEDAQQTGDNVPCELQTRRGSNKAVSENVLEVPPMESWPVGYHGFTCE